MLFLKYFLLKAYTFLKHYWYLPVAFVVAIIGWLLLRKQNPMKLISDIISIHNAEVATLEKIKRDEIAAREKAQNDYIKKIEKIDKDHESGKKTIDEKKRDKIEKLLEKETTDPDVLTKKVAEIGGFRVVVADE